MSNDFRPKCKVCGLHPEDIAEYVECAADMGVTPSKYVVLEEGTYNTTTKQFYCTTCYIKVGMPLGKA